MSKSHSYKTALGRKASIEVRSLTGEVIDINRNVKTHLNVSGGGSYSSSGNGHATASSRPINVRSSNSVHDDVFVTDSNGTEHHLVLVDWESSGIRKGHTIQVLSVYNFQYEGYKQIVTNLDDYVVVNNKGLNKVFYNNSLIKRISSPPAMKDVISDFIKTSFFPKFFLGCLVFWIIFGFSGTMGSISAILMIAVPVVAVVLWLKQIKKTITLTQEVVEKEVKPIIEGYIN